MPARHGWDVARATGQTVDWRDSTAQWALDFSHQALRSIPADRSPFGPPQPVAETAAPMDRLVGLLGRSAA